MSDERIDQIESDVRHLTRMLGDLMREVRRNANEIAEIHRRSKDQEWEARVASLWQPQSDRLKQNMRKLREESVGERS